MSPFEEQSVEASLRWGFVAILVSTFILSSVYRARARRQSGTIPRRQEGTWAMILRALLGLPLFISLLAYAVNPDWMRWSYIRLPDWTRWLALAVGGACVAFLWWVFASIGENISETILTKPNHRLVRSGPYRWIRHPLYTGALTTFFALGVIASNGFIAGLIVIAAVLFRTIVIPREEEQLIAKFGEEYLVYQKSTGRMLPRLPR